MLTKETFSIHESQGGERLGDETGGSEQTDVMQQTGTDFNKHCLFLKMAASSAALDELEKLFGQDLKDNHFISTNVDMSLKFVITSWQIKG